MSDKKNAFDWNDGTPSIWQRDKELRQITQGKAWGLAVQAQIELHKKKQVTVYSHAKPSNK
jgi:hypothetical protein